MWDGLKGDARKLLKLTALRKVYYTNPVEAEKSANSEANAGNDVPTPKTAGRGALGANEGISDSVEQSESRQIVETPILARLTADELNTLLDSDDKLVRRLLNEIEHLHMKIHNVEDELARALQVIEIYKSALNF